MLAMVGWVFPEIIYHLPNAAYAQTNPLYAVGSVGFLPVLQILLFIAVCEGATYAKVYEDNCADPGNFGFDPFGLAKAPARKAHYQLAEIKNGRLAMCAIGGAIHHALLTNVGLVEQIASGKWSKLFSFLSLTSCLCILSLTLRSLSFVPFYSWWLLPPLRDLSLTGVERNATWLRSIRSSRMFYKIVFLLAKPILYPTFTNTCAPCNRPEG